MAGVAATTALATALVLSPFGALTDHIQQFDIPWYGFDAKDALLSLVRIEKTHVSDCKSWVGSGLTDPAPVIPNEPSPQQLALAFEPLSAPMSANDLESIRGCEDFPCAVKFNESEVRQMASEKRSARLRKYNALVAARVSAYTKTQKRRVYEVGGDPIDPWQALLGLGLKPDGGIPTQESLSARKLNFAPDRMQTMHQIVDRRVARNEDGTRAWVFLRDAYTDHYFDGWGEWSVLDCDPKTGTAIAAFGLLCEMDLLKGGGIFGGLAYPKYRAAFEANGKTFLDKKYAQLK